MQRKTLLKRGGTFSDRRERCVEGIDEVDGRSGEVLRLARFISTHDWKPAV